METTLHGIDFSGREQPGPHIWLAEASATADTLHIESCTSAADRFGVAERAPCLGRLTEFLQNATVVGLDFPFGVPAVVHERDSWEESLEWVTTVAHDAEEFQSTCRSKVRDQTDGERADFRRKTDESAGGMCPYNNRVRSMTFYGMRDVLAPLAGTDEVAVHPMQPDTEKTQTHICEVYPAATLNSLHLPAEKYKGNTDNEFARDRRKSIVNRLESESPITLADDVRGILINDAGGDALDSVVAALGTYRAWQTDFETDRPYDNSEGYIYV